MVNRFVQCNGFQQKPAVFIFLLLALRCFYYFFVVLFSSLSFFLFLFYTLRTASHHTGTESKCIALEGVGYIMAGQRWDTIVHRKKGRQSRWFWSRWIKKDKETNSTCNYVCTWIVSLSCGMDKGIGHVECVEIVVLPRMLPCLMIIAIVSCYIRE